MLSEIASSVSGKWTQMMDLTSVDIAAIEFKGNKHEPAPCHDPKVDL